MYLPGKQKVVIASMASFDKGSSVTLFAEEFGDSLFRCCFRTAGFMGAVR